MIKILLLIILFLLIVYIGYGILSYYKRRKKFYSDLCLFLENLKSEICFLKTDLKSILEKQKNCYCTEINNILDEYYKYLCNGLKENLDIKCKLLSIEEVNELKELFYKLGRTTLDEQNNCIAHYNGQFMGRLSKIKEEINSNGIVAFKLCIILGLFAVIILI